MTRVKPADVLGYVREEIAYLREKEAELKARLIAEGASDGEMFDVELCEVRRKVFRYDRLPHDVLRDPHYWDERYSVELRVVEKTEGEDRLSA